MADPKYIIPDPPQYKANDIRAIKNSDPVNADEIVNPVILAILESIAYNHKHKADLDENGKVDPGQLPDYGALIMSALPVRADIVIPSSGWRQDGDIFALELPVEQARAELVPIVSLLPESLETAKLCSMSPSVEALDGVLRLSARAVPVADMPASLLLFSIGTGGTGGAGGDYKLPTASAERLGGVKIGDGLSVTSDGTISVDPGKVMTMDDLVDEKEVAQSVADILK